MISGEQNNANLISNFFSTITTKKAIIIISILGIIVFGNSLVNQFIGDDISQLIDRQEAHSLTRIGSFFNGQISLNTAYYKPVFNTFTSFIYSLFGPSQIAFHSFSIILHIASVILLFLVLTQFFRKPLALLLSSIFLVHPINSEVVFYVSDLQDSLFFFFGILGLYKLTKAKSVGSIVLVSFLLFLSVLSKETGALFSLVAILYSLILNRKYLYQLLGILGFTGLIYLGLRTSALGFFALPTLAPIAQLNLSERLLNIPAILFFYIKTFFYPIALSASQHWFIHSLDFYNFYFPLLIDLLVIGIIAYFAIKLYKKTDSFNFKLYLFFSLWLVVGLLLHLQIIPLDATVADRWFYFPIVGVLGIIGTLLQAYNINLSNKYAVTIIIIILTLLSIRTFDRSFDWRDEFALAKHDVKVSDSHILENSLASKLLIMGRYDEAKPHAERSVELFPYQSNLNTLGSIYFYLHEYSAAKEQYKRALQLGDSRVAYSNLALLAIVTNDNLENTKEFIQDALEKYPNDLLLLSNLSIVEYKLGNIDKAKSVISKVYSYDNGSYIKGIYDVIMSGRKDLEFNLTP